MVFKRLSLMMPLSLLFFLPACKMPDWFGQKKVPTVNVQEDGGYFIEDDTSAVLATMDGKPIVTEKVLEAELQKAIEADPQVKMMLAYIDEKQLKKQLLDSLVSKVIMDRVLTEKNIKESEEYIADYNRIISQIKDMLNAKYFTKSFDTKVPEAEMRAYYEKNKDVIPDLMISRGGVKAMGVMAESQEAANQLAEKVKAAQGDIKKVAKEAGIADEKVRDYNLVNNQSLGIDPAIREKVVALQKFPAVEVVKAGDNYWVVAATAKEEAQYRPFDQVKTALERELMQTKVAEQFEKELAKYKDGFNISIDESFFGGAQEKEKSAQDIMDALQGGQENEEATPEAAQAF